MRVRARPRGSYWRRVRADASFDVFMSTWEMRPSIFHGRVHFDLAYAGSDCWNCHKSAIEASAFFMTAGPTIVPSMTPFLLVVMCGRFFRYVWRNSSTFSGETTTLSGGSSTPCKNDPGCATHHSFHSYEPRARARASEGSKESARESERQRRVNTSVVRARARARQSCRTAFPPHVAPSSAP